MMINNFILVRYLGSDHKYHKANEKYRDKLFVLTVLQLTKFHPNAKIHVITNTRSETCGNTIYHHVPDLPLDNRAKFLVFGLLDEPAMYVDDDLLFHRPFAEAHTPNGSPFNCYKVWERMSFQAVSKVELKIKEGDRYNNGVVWIPKPSKDIVKEMQHYQNDFFDTREKTIALGMGFPSSEYAMSYYVAAHALKMKLDKDVNAFFEDEYDPHSVQSVHYAGYNKTKLFSDYLKMT